MGDDEMETPEPLSSLLLQLSFHPHFPLSFRCDLRGAAAGQGRLEGEGRGKNHSRPEHAEAEGGGEACHLSVKKGEGLWVRVWGARRMGGEGRGVSKEGTGQLTRP